VSRRYALVKSPFGYCAVVCEGEEVLRILIGHPSRKSVLQQISREFPNAREGGAEPRCCAGQIMEYLHGERERFSVKLRTDGLTPFQRRVFRVVERIPYGQVRSYGWVATRAMGSARAARAVGNALARNPFPLVVPCHRVVRSDGSLGGFSAPGELILKRRLLELERGSESD